MTKGKLIFILFWITIALYFMQGCEKRPIQEKPSLKISRKDVEAINVVKKIQYIYDPRTDICYAIVYPEGYSMGITVVDYNKVKDKVHVVIVTK